MNPTRACKPQGTLHGVASRALVVPLMALSACIAGCGSTKIDSTYGRHPGSQGAKSVNGTAVLSGMFRQAGHKVSSWHRISPKLEKDDVIIWAPDDLGDPGKEQREWLEKWLSEEDGRTLVYIGRDYDAAITYWEKIRGGTPPQQANEVDRRRATAKADHETRRTQMPINEDVDWFTVERDGPKRDVRQLSGPWSRGVDASKVEIHIEGRLIAPKQSRGVRALLSSKGDILVSQLNDIGPQDSQLILVTNGSFLLNLPLVNHEHRKLAGALIDQCEARLPKGEKHLSVVFLESGPQGATVLEIEPSELSGWEALTIWPLNAIVMHVAILGTLLCFALFPIFGRPRELREDSRSDLGKHISALGLLLERTKDHAYANSRVADYQQRVRRDSGVSHIDLETSE